jgi:hypothetical protein
MNLVSLKNAFVAAAFLLAVGHTDMTPAHSLSGTLRARAQATDLYQITCFAEDGGPPTDRLRVHVRDNPPVRKPLVSVQVQKGSVATNRTDATDGNAEYSPWATIHGGDGVYHVSVDKSSAGAETYSLEFHCESSTDIHTGTEDVQLQNQ